MRRSQKLYTTLYKDNVVLYIYMAASIVMHSKCNLILECWMVEDMINKAQCTHNTVQATHKGPSIYKVFRND